MITLEVPERFQDLTNPDTLEQAAALTLEHEGVSSDAAVSVVLTDDAQIQQLNRQFLGIDTPTDVLSFPADYTDPDNGMPYLGDVIISYPRAEAQSTAAGHPVGDELQLLVVHGVLHLLGHDHVEEEEKARMWASQTDILEELGVGGINPSL